MVFQWSRTLRRGEILTYFMAWNGIAKPSFTPRLGIRWIRTSVPPPPVIRGTHTFAPRPAILATRTFARPRATRVIRIFAPRQPTTRKPVARLAAQRTFAMVTTRYGHPRGWRHPALPRART